jgi:formamidopyrimidine-DNA glycosylase
MPELPEVEVTRISLADRLRDARVLSARLGKPLRWPLGCRPAALQGLTIGELERRGKYLWMPLQGTRRRGGLLLHLGMSGSLALHEGAAPKPGVHDHFELVTSAGTLTTSMAPSSNAIGPDDGAVPRATTSSTAQRY